jgi:hypothetical protein
MNIFAKVSPKSIKTVFLFHEVGFWWERLANKPHPTLTIRGDGLGDDFCKLSMCSIEIPDPRSPKDY